MGEPDDATEILRRVADGDDEALRELYRRHSRLAYLLAFRILGREELAEDAVQEAFLRLWRNAHRFRPERGSFTTWFGRVVRNLCIDMLRRRDPLSTAPPPSSTWMACSLPTRRRRPSPWTAS